MGSSTHRRVALAVLATVLLCKAVPGRGMTECELELAGTQERLRKAELKIASQTRELAGEEEPELATLAAASEDGSLDVKTPTDIAAAAAFHVDALLESQTGDPHNFNDKKDDEDLPGAPHCDTDALGQKTEICLLGDANTIACLTKSPGRYCECFREPGTWVAECLTGCWPKVEKALCGDTDGKARASFAEDGGCDRSTVTQHTKSCVAADTALAACVGKDPPGSCDCLRQSKTAQTCLAECWGTVEAAMCTEQDLDAESAAKKDCNRATVAAKSKQCVESDQSTLLCLQEGGEECGCLKTSRAVQDCLGGCWPVVEGAVCGVN